MPTTSIRKLCCTSRNVTAAFISLTCVISSFALAAKGWIPPFSGEPGKDAAPTPAVHNIPRFKERLLQVDIDQQQLNQTVLVLEDNDGGLYLWGKDLQRWRFRQPDANTAIVYQGEKYYPLSAISDISHEYDQKNLTLNLKVSPDAFTETTRSAQAEKIAPLVKSSVGGFINYDLLAGDSTETSQRSGQFEFGYFNHAGVGTTNVLAEHINSGSRTIRLDSTWTTDFPEKMQTLHLGDSVSIPGTWGSSMRFAGVQYGSNFGTQPSFVISPPQRALGQATVPSTVDVFINNALASHQSVPPGPFSISNLPAITGAGEVRLVVRDLMGREQIITRSFYGSQTLLSKGLENFSYEFGAVRENFGINSNEYGNWLGSGTYRRGLSDQFTGEIHAEAMGSQMTVGAGGDTLLPKFGTINTYIAGSQNNAAYGVLTLVGFDRLAQPWSIGARTQWTTVNYTQLGLASPQLAPAQLSSANLSYALHAGGAVGIAYVGQRNRDQADARIATLNYSVSLGKMGSLIISALQNLAEDSGRTYYAMFSLSLDNSTSLYVSSQFMRNGNDYTTTLQHNLPPGEGYGYRLQGSTSGAREASYSMQNNIGTYVINAAQNHGEVVTRLNASGGIAVLGGNPFLSRRIDQSFAVVRIPDYPKVRVLADNQLAGLTNADGNALIPRLRAYDNNMISIDQRDLPLDAEINTLKLDAIPFYRSGIEMKFPIKHSRGATLTIRLENGKYLPVGASVQEVGKEEIFVAGYEGEVYIVGLGSTTTLRATWNNQSCTFDVSFTLSANPLPDLGIYICKGVKP
jgi:outer membrane usher protein